MMKKQFYGNIALSFYRNSACKNSSSDEGLYQLRFGDNLQQGPGVLLVTFTIAFKNIGTFDSEIPSFWAFKKPPV
jgi:hypothetical protein